MHLFKFSCILIAKDKLSNYDAVFFIGVKMMGAFFLLTFPAIKLNILFFTKFMRISK